MYEEVGDENNDIDGSGHEEKHEPKSHPSALPPSPSPHPPPPSPCKPLIPLPSGVDDLPPLEGGPGERMMMATFPQTGSSPFLPFDILTSMMNCGSVGKDCSDQRDGNLISLGSPVITLEKVADDCCCVSSEEAPLECPVSNLPANCDEQQQAVSSESELPPNASHICPDIPQPCHHNVSQPCPDVSQPCLDVSQLSPDDISQLLCPDVCEQCPETSTPIEPINKKQPEEEDNSNVISISCYSTSKDESFFSCSSFKAASASPPPPPPLPPLSQHSSQASCSTSLIPTPKKGLIRCSTFNRSVSEVVRTHNHRVHIM